MGLAEILAFLKILPSLYQSAKDLIEWAKKTFGPNWDQALVDGAKGFALLPAAKTPEERKAALDAIARGFNPH